MAHYDDGSGPLLTCCPPHEEGREFFWVAMHCGHPMRHVDTEDYSTASVAWFTQPFIEHSRQGLVSPYWRVDRPGFITYDGPQGKFVWRITGETREQWLGQQRPSNLEPYFVMRGVWPD